MWQKVKKLRGVQTVATKESSAVHNIVAFVDHEHSSKRHRRKTIPERPNYSVNLWSIMKNCIGKELSKIPMPVSIQL